MIMSLAPNATGMSSDISNLRESLRESRLEEREENLKKKEALLHEKEKAIKAQSMELKNTVDQMLSDDYKERFRAEYRQTKIRYEKLKAFNNRIEAANTTCGYPKSVEMPKHDCPDYLLREQQKTMGEYLHILEVRAVIEGIEL